VELNAQAILTDSGMPGFSETVDSSVVFVSNSTRVADCLKGTEGIEFDFSCTATITPTDSPPISDSAGTTRRCYDLDVTKTASGSVDYSFDWSLNKTASPRHDSLRRTDLAIDAGDDEQSVQYSLKATATVVEGDYVVTGEVTVSNHHPTDTANVDVTDVTFGTAVFGGDCAGGVAAVPALGSVTCPYTVTVAFNPKERTNVAAASHFGVSYEGDASFTFAINPVDPSVTISDQFDDGTEQQICEVGVEAPFSALVFTCFTMRKFGAETCLPNANEPSVASYPNTGRIRSLTGDLIDSSNWVTTVTTICETCAECKDPVMYPGYRGGDIHHAQPSAPGAKTVSLCWD
jgi:hypothetical protein